MTAPAQAPGLLARGVRRLSDTAVGFVEGRRMDRIRRDPRGLMAALRSAEKVLIVCHGNIIRSPFAARLVARELGDGRGVAIASAGLAATPGSPSPLTALLVAARRRVDLGDHVASALTPETVATSDVIFVMDVAQLGQMGRRFPEDRARTFLLTSLAPRSAREVRDPVDGDESVFEACYGHITEAVRPIVSLLAEGSGRR